MKEKSISIGWFGPTHDHWDWIRRHFRDVTPLTRRNVEEWSHSKIDAMKSEEDGGVSALLCAVEYRFDPDLDFIKGFEGKVNSLPFCMLLGDDWVGHRRTHPLSESLQTFYWYELYDRLMPWLLNLPPVGNAISFNETDSSADKRRVSPRVQRLIDASMFIEASLSDGIVPKTMKQALIVTETATTRQLWCDVLVQREIQCVATTPDNLNVWTDPNIIVIDLESVPLQSRELMQSREIDRTLSLVQSLVKQFPDATLIVADAFPRWETWRKLTQSGADVMVAKPFQLNGILETLVQNRH